MDYTLLILFCCIEFFLLNLAPITGAWLLADKIAENRCSRWALAGFFFLLESSIIFSSAGFLGVLTTVGSTVIAAMTGIIFIVLAMRLKKRPGADVLAIAEKSFAERVFEIALIFLLAVIAIKAAYLAGTDTMMYHLYYPATWITDGRISAIPLQGLPHEYFPICGETIYGWLMFSSVEVPLVSLLQLAAALMALLAAAGLWEKFNVPSVYIKLGMLLTLANGIILENTALCYTDTLTGAFLLAGLAWLVRSFSQTEKLTVQDYICCAAGSLAMGMCAAVKYSGLVLAPLITLFLLLYFLIKDMKKAQLASRCKLYLITVVCATLSAGIFYLPNWLKTGNPFYPVKIPFIFSNGVDFDYPPVAPNKMWSFFVNDNPWSMNIFSALLFLLLPIVVCLMVCLKSRNSRSTSKLPTDVIIALALILPAAEIIMLLIYPAMTQARQIIPYLFALSILFAPALYLLIPRLERTDWQAAVYSVAALLFCVATAYNRFYSNYFILTLLLVILCMATAMFRKAKTVKIINIILIILGVSIIVLLWNVCKAARNNLMETFTSPAIKQGIQAIQNYTLSTGKPAKIAACGCWFNYYMLMDMPSNQVRHVPINKENTASVHLAGTPEKLRTPVEYPIWLERLKQGGFTHLVIQLDGHQDYPVNRDKEFIWAMEHPQNFILLHNDNNVWFFAIRY